jgi:hypothetical protein
MYDWEVIAKSRALSQELSDLVAADQKHRTRGYVVWSDLKQHQERLVRVHEIKEELAKLARRKK